MIRTTFRLLKHIESGKRRLEADFSIDPAFELAQLVYGDGSDPGPLLTPDLSFCIVSGDNCATYPRQFDICVSIAFYLIAVNVDVPQRDSVILFLFISSSSFRHLFS